MKCNFKRQKLSLKSKIIITIFLSIITTIFLIKNFNNLVCKKIIDYSKEVIEYQNREILKNAFNNSVKIDVNNLINVVKNSKDEIVEVDFKIDECNKLLNSITSNMNTKTNNISNSGYLYEIPMGVSLNSPLFVNLGPKIPLKITVLDSVLGNIKTKVSPFGINNALIEVYLEISIQTITSLTLTNDKNITSYEALITSKIVNAKVPEFYNGSYITSKTLESQLNS